MQRILILTVKCLLCEHAYSFHNGLFFASFFGFWFVLMTLLYLSFSRFSLRSCCYCWFFILFRCTDAIRVFFVFCSRAREKDSYSVIFANKNRGFQCRLSTSATKFSDWSIWIYCMCLSLIVINFFIVAVWFFRWIWLHQNCTVRCKYKTRRNKPKTKMCAHLCSEWMINALMSQFTNHVTRVFIYFFVIFVSSDNCIEI